MGKGRKKSNDKPVPRRGRRRKGKLKLPYTEDERLFSRRIGGAGELVEIREKMQAQPAEDLVEPDIVSTLKDPWRLFRIMGEFVDGFDTLARVGPAVSVFGSSRTKPNDPDYRAATETARLLAEAGFAVITGAGPGIMEAANKGAQQGDGLSIGRARNRGMAFRSASTSSSLSSRGSIATSISRSRSAISSCVRRCL